MKTRLGKVFLNKNKDVIVVDYLPSDGYYTVVDKELSKGNAQVIITSNIMLELIETLITRHSFDVTHIEFMVDSSDFEEEINSLLASLHRNKAFWAVIKEKLAFLQKEESIEIKKVTFKSLASGETADVFVNGIISSSGEFFDSFSSLISACIKRCLV